MLHKLGWWAIGVALECLGVSIALVCVALLAMGASLSGGNPAVIVLAVVVGIMVIGAALGGPGYLAARFGGGGEVMGLAVGVFAAALVIALQVALMMTAKDVGPPPIAGVSVGVAVLLILPPAIGGWWARHEAERKRRVEPQSDPEELVPGAPAEPSG